jgi:hypothetical protein
MASRRDQSDEKLEKQESNETLVTREFRPRGSQTKLVLRHEEFAFAETRGRHERRLEQQFRQIREVI